MDHRTDRLLCHSIGLRMNLEHTGRCDDRQDSGGTPLPLDKNESTLPFDLIYFLQTRMTSFGKH